MGSLGLLEGAPCHVHGPVTTKPSPMAAQPVPVPKAEALPLVVSHVLESCFPSGFPRCFKGHFSSNVKFLGVVPRTQKFKSPLLKIEDC